MEQNPSSEAKSCSASQEISPFIKPNASLSCSHKPVIGHKLESDE